GHTRPTDPAERHGRSARRFPPRCRRRSAPPPAAPAAAASSVPHPAPDRPPSSPPPSQGFLQWHTICALFHPQAEQSRMSEIILINISGQDKPGLTASLMGILAEYNVGVLDIGQAMIHETLS